MFGHRFESGRLHLFPNTHSVSTFLLNGFFVSLVFDPYEVFITIKNKLVSAFT